MGAPPLRVCVRCPLPGGPIAQVLVHQQDLRGLLHPHHGSPQDHQTPADAIRALAVVAAVRLHGTGGLLPQPLGVFGRGDVPGPPQGLLQGGGQLVPADHEVDPLMAVERAGHPVAGSVDVDDLPGLRQAVGGGDVHLGPGRPGVGVGVALPVPDHLVVGRQLLIEPHLLQGDGAAEAHDGSVDGAVQVRRRVRRGGKGLGDEAALLQVLSRSLQIHVKAPPCCIPRIPRPGRPGRRRRSETPWDRSHRPSV